MNIYETIEVCHLDKAYLTPEIRKQVLESFSQQQWLGVIKFFLRSLDNGHTVAGKDIQRLYDYVNYYQERDQFTWRQHWHAIAILVDNWDQISCESRANLLI